MRIWIYQSSRDFSDYEIGEIESLGLAFVDQWTSHGANMKAELKTKYNRFILIFADEEQAHASGCSIDKSVHFIQELEKTFSTSLLDRSVVAFRDKNKISTFKFTEFDTLFSKGLLQEETIIFNNLITSPAELESNWEIPINKSWLNKFLTPAKK